MPNVRTNVALDPGGASLVEQFEDFLGTAVLATNEWSWAVINSSTVSQAGVTDGAALITTGAADDDDQDLASGLVWTASHACGVEIRFSATDVTAAAFCLGFSDAVTETGDAIAIDFTANALRTNATNAVCFVLDPDYTTAPTHVYLTSVKADTDGTPVDTGIVPVAATYYIYRLQFDTAGNVTAYINGVQVGSLSAAITTTTPLCAYVGCMNREGAANTWKVDYIHTWQNRT
jgi:hypothetical protein